MALDFSVVRTGLIRAVAHNPALKRWAIFGRPRWDARSTVRLMHGRSDAAAAYDGMSDEVVRARSLDSLEKTRVFGMTFSRTPLRMALSRTRRQEHAV